MVADAAPDPAVDVDVLRGRLRDWLDANWDPELSLVEWRTRLADAGWARPSWPSAWGGLGLPAWASEAVDAELAAHGAAGVPEGVGMLLAAPTVLEHGDDDVRRRFLRPTVTGELVWCQLFSEPGAGSDLAGLRTHAARDGDGWVVRGQKVWTTSAAHADVGLLLARSDPDVPKHAGLTCFVLPMRQRGVEVRPLRQMNGHASFNEVFLDDAEVPSGHVVGGVNKGWSVALTTLAHERRMAILSRGAPPLVPGSGRVAREAIEEHERVAEPYRWYPQRAGRVDLVIPRARATGRSADPLVRDEVARLVALARTAQLTSQRATAARVAGPPAGTGGVDRQARQQQHRARRGERAHHDRGRNGDARRRGRAARRHHHRGARLGARGLHRRRHRRDPAQHPCRAGSWPAQGARSGARGPVLVSRRSRDGDVRFLDRDGVRIAYEVHGEGRQGLPLLLSHGFSSSSAMWAPNLDALAADRPVLTWDMRGHGESDSPEDPSRYTESASVEDMAAVLDACGVDRAAVGGLSLGGYLSLAFHARHRSRVSALLLFDTGPGYRSAESRERWNRWAAAQAEAFDAEGLDALSTSSEVRRGAHDPAGLSRAARGILVQRTSAVIDSLPSIGLPTLVLVGAEDAPFLTAADYMAARIPGATKVVLPRAGHASNLDQPDAFNRAVRTFLRDLSDARGAGSSSL